MKLLLILGLLYSFIVSSSVRAQILAEAFRSIGCTNCPVPDKQYEGFVASIASNPKSKVEIVYFHNNVATNDDPFYALAKADIDIRQGGSFYAVASDPELFLNGTDAGSNFDGWQTLTNEAVSSNQNGTLYSATLTASASIDGAGMLHVDLHADGNSSGKLVKPYAMLVESGIKYSNKEGYGNPTSGIWDNVFRAMIPGSQGGNVITLNGPNDFHYIYNPAGKPWVLSNCKIVAFLQEVQASSGVNHPIDALTTSPITTSGVTNSYNIVAPHINAPIPNPSNSTAQIPFHLAAPANIKIVICDDLGREVETIYNGFAEESSFATFTPKNLSRGIYYARMYAGGAYVGMQKIVFAP